MQNFKNKTNRMLSWFYCKEIYKIFKSNSAFKNKSWKHIEYFNPIWKNRIKTMANIIPSKCNSIMDIGCGKMWLKEFLPSHIIYIPVDYTFRGEGTIICDFNNKEFPNRHVDCCFVSGCYVQDKSPIS